MSFGSYFCWTRIIVQLLSISNAGRIENAIVCASLDVSKAGELASLSNISGLVSFFLGVSISIVECFSLDSFTSLLALDLSSERLGFFRVSFASEEEVSSFRLFDFLMESVFSPS